jgi:hypothetical protein
MRYLLEDTMDIDIEKAKCNRCNKMRQLPFEKSIFMEGELCCWHCNHLPFNLNRIPEFDATRVHKDDFSSDCMEWWANRYRAQFGRCSGCNLKAKKLRIKRSKLGKPSSLVCYKCYWAWVRRSSVKKSTKLLPNWFSFMPKWQQRAIASNPHIQKEVDYATSPVLNSESREISNYA